MKKSSLVPLIINVIRSARGKLIPKKNCIKDEFDI
jgi:hypothetical protein